MDRIGARLSSERLEGEFQLGAETVIQLPSYRWLSLQPFTFGRATGRPDDNETFRNLAGSKAFDRPFIFRASLGELHGPFPTGELSTDDFERMSAGAAKLEILKAVASAASWMDKPDPPDAATHTTIVDALREIPDDCRAWHLAVDPWISRDRLHEVGWVLWEFNEFVFLNADCGIGWFAVIGMD